MQPLIPIAKPTLGEPEAEAVREAILSGWVTQGPQVAAFEREFAEYVGVRFACAVSNCTTALHLALHALGIGPGDEVVTVSHSFIATANVIRYCGATPVFVDIDPDTFNIDPELLAIAITSRTKAILPVHQIGLPCDLQQILAIAEQHGLPVIEDAACAIGSEILWQGNWDRIGKAHGAVACFSFHPRKIVTTGDGGMITTNDPELDKQFRLLRQHGMSIPDTVRDASRQVVFEEYPIVGFNYRMTDVQAAIGRVQLRRLPGVIEKRVALAERYTAAIAEIPGLIPPQVNSDVRTNYQSYAVRVTPEYPLTRDQLMQSLLDANISTRRGIMNAHQEPAYASYADLSLPQSEAARDNVILLPLFDALSEQDQDRVIAGLVAPVAALTTCEPCMKPLILLGCGGNAYDVLDIVDAINAVRPTWRIVGFLDDAREVNSQFAGYPILGRIAAAGQFGDSQFINTIGSDQSFQRRPEIIAATKLAARQFATLVHPGASVSSRATVGHGVYVGFGASIAGAVMIGDHVSIGAQATIGHDSTIGDYSIVAPAAVVSGFVTVEAACYVGAAAILKQKLTIGAGSLVGMAACVTRDVTAGEVVMGNPARPRSLALRN